MIERYDGPYLYRPLSTHPTRMQLAVVHAGRTLTAKRGRPPTHRELAKALSITTGRVRNALRRAVLFGAVRVSKRAHRGIFVVDR